MAFSISRRLWAAAYAEHQEAVAEFAALIRAVPPRAWQAPLGEGKWTPAVLAVHVTRAYEFGREGIQGGPGMRLRVHPAWAWVLGHTLLPVLFVMRRLPSGVNAPREVRPDVELAATLSQAAAVDRLTAAAGQALAAIADPARARDASVTHAYFGTLTPRMGLRMLTVHTRHHSRQLADFLARETPVRAGPA